MRHFAAGAPADGLNNYEATGPPAIVEVDIMVRSMGPISEIDMTYSMDCYFRQSWIDRRLSFSGHDNDTLALSITMLERIWKPDTYFYNGKQSYLHTITTPNQFVRLHHDGRVLYSSSRKAREITSPTASSPLKMSTAVVDETSGRNSDRPLCKCNLTGRESLHSLIDIDSPKLPSLNEFLLFLEKRATALEASNSEPESKPKEKLYLKKEHNNLLHLDRSPSDAPNFASKGTAMHFNSCEAQRESVLLPTVKVKIRSSKDYNKDDLNDGSIYSMAHHSVIREDKKTTKLRVVFDGSMKSKDKRRRSLKKMNWVAKLVPYRSRNPHQKSSTYVLQDSVPC
ncbi:hypothetical protein HUJ05_001964 [Dendroctonus ponderosae]|nr:hypothetical protein HUJ05_001964 [Dendroctonus ponderosae]